VRGFSAGMFAIAEEDSAALVVSVGGCAGGWVGVTPSGKGRIAALMNDVTGWAGGWAGVSALGTVMFRCSGRFLAGARGTCSGSCPHSRRGITPSEKPAQDAERYARVATRTPGSLGAKRTKTTEVTQMLR